MMKNVALVLAALLMTNVASASMTAEEASYMRTVIAQEQQKINVQQVFVSELQAKVAKKQQANALNKGAVRVAQWTTIPLAAYETVILGKALSLEIRKAWLKFIDNKSVRGSRINIRKQIIIASTAIAAYYGSDAYNQGYVLVQTKDLGKLQGQLDQALEVLSARQETLVNLESKLNEQL